RIAHAKSAMLDMPASPKNLLEKTAAIQKKMNAINLTFNGDATRAKREFETATTVNDRVGILEYTVWNITSSIPKSCKTNYDIASRQFSKVLEEMKMVDAQISDLEKELEMNKAPYTPGRWPK
ncbi:MAG TPA: glycosyl hydrolase, partial [Saprospiraceae bacterium]|nr:glycosyl hydrolase [Saprospiraceae bacterium]